ncbi:Protein of unknown function [Lactobacillus helveticus CIRM-BIA 101]|nr:Protein of unknown function [Lactobacillus helveticus CIRM-BIA 101]
MTQGDDKDGFYLT